MESNTFYDIYLEELKNHSRNLHAHFAGDFTRIRLP